MSDYMSWFMVICAEGICMGNICVSELYGCDVGCIHAQLLHDVGYIHAQLLHELAMPYVFQVSLVYACLRLNVGCFMWISSVFRKNGICSSIYHMYAAYVLYVSI